MTDILSRPLVAVASPEDATATARAVRAHRDALGDIVLLHVVEKGGGGVDKASVEQREEHAERAFEAFRTVLSDTDVETEIAYATNVADGILEAARDVDASAIVFTSRGGGWLASVLSEDVSEDLLRNSDRPILALPDPEGGSGS